LTVEDTVVRGRLFETSSGIPILEVPENDILAVGTTKPLADLPPNRTGTRCMWHKSKDLRRLRRNGLMHSGSVKTIPYDASR